MQTQTAAKTYTTRTICLKTYDYGEADKILHLYSPHLGRISAMAKGARRANSKLSGACELLALTQMQLTRGRNFDVVNQYQSMNSFIGIRSDILKLAFANLYAELVHGLTTEEDEDSEGVFGLLETSLRQLEETPEALTSYQATAFQVSLLSITGFMPMLSHCQVSDEPVRDEVPYYAFSAEHGGIVLPEHRQHITGASWVNVSTPTLQALLACVEGDTAVFLQADALKVQKFLAWYYQRLLEKPVKACNFVYQLLETA